MEKIILIAALFGSAAFFVEKVLGFLKRSRGSETSGRVGEPALKEADTDPRLAELAEEIEKLKEALSDRPAWARKGIDPQALAERDAAIAALKAENQALKEEVKALKGKKRSRKAPEFEIVE
ncbi:hypothetical protein [Pelomicrobium methylotrophicum]|uniref:Uncharacterized protein n=1 Tax=Pelomicrobium methylotrophicum TaxID=2602750 RepID=A0A5C7EVQ6_9PROT|nr:hypothetical protein [Pelomicrobium methylotrophicum]TXF11145.1 hypothetical protein FR698_11560 [Pelomicrobium methylotrophicum]